MELTRNVTLGQYVPGNSIIHQLDPRIKLMAVFILMSALFLTSNLWAYLLLFLFTLVLCYLSSLPFGFVMRGLRPVLFLLIFTFILNVLFTKGNMVLWQWGFVNISGDGLRMGFLMICRLTLLVIVASLLTLTSSPIELTDGIERLIHPLRRVGVPSHEISMMMTIALRFVPTLLEETEKIIKAQMARGVDFEEGSLLKRAKSMIAILVPLFVSSFRRADELAVAMEARCYHGGEGRTKLKQLQIRSADYVALVVVLLVVAGIILFR